jgi:hypothetical protein
MVHLSRLPAERHLNDQASPSHRLLSAVRCGVLCVATLAAASFCCGVLLAAFDAIGTERPFAPLAFGLALLRFGTLFFGLPTAIISGAIVWLRQPITRRWCRSSRRRSPIVPRLQARMPSLRRRSGLLTVISPPIR